MSFAHRRAAPLMLSAALVAPAAVAQPVVAPLVADVPPDPAADGLTVDQALSNARRFARIRSYADCLADRRDSGDIVVCGAPSDEGLPVPEVYGPVAGSTDGAAVDPHIPCEFTAEHCYTGLDLIRIGRSVAGLIGLVIDPDRNLGEGDRIPDRFRGANR